VVSMRKYQKAALRPPGRLRPFCGTLPNVASMIV
jgi:hypothetical protein